MIKLVISQEFQTFNVHFSSLRRMSLLIAMWPMRDKCKFHKTSILTMFWVIIFKKVWWLVKPWSRASISRTRLFLICWSRISRGNCEAGIVRWPHVIPLCRVASHWKVFLKSWKFENMTRSHHNAGSEKEDSFSTGQIIPLNFIGGRPWKWNLWLGPYEESIRTEGKGYERREWRKSIIGEGGKWATLDEVSKVIRASPKYQLIVVTAGCLSPSWGPWKVRLGAREILDRTWLSMYDYLAPWNTRLACLGLIEPLEEYIEKEGWKCMSLWKSKRPIGKRMGCR